MTKRVGSLERRPFYQPLIYVFCKWSTYLAMVFLYRLRRRGVRKIPTSGPCLLIANHQSYLDPPILGACVRRRQMYPLARIGLFKGLLGWLILHLNAIPLDQESSNGGAASSAIRTALKRLGEGAPVCIFPEGARTPDGEVHTFQRGVMLLIKRARCPIVPVAIEGAFQAWPRTRKRPRLFGRINVLIGEPIDSNALLEQYGNDAIGEIEKRVRALHETLRDRMR